VVGEYGPNATEEEKVYVHSTDGAVLYAATGVAQGYQSPIKVLVAVEADGPDTPLSDNPVIHRMAVVSSQETPGLGETINQVDKDVSVWAALAGRGGESPSDAKRPGFQDQFTGKRLSDLVVEKTPGTDKIQALTGATITSKAATQAARNAVQTIISKTAEAYGQ
jgi:electron transport complex protein RnfG